MTEIAVDCLLALAVAAAWLGAAALLLLETSYERLHAVGYVAATSGFFVTAAVVVAHPDFDTAPEAILIFIALMLSGAILNHAIGRAVILREESGDRP